MSTARPPAGRRVAGRRAGLPRVAGRRANPPEQAPHPGQPVGLPQDLDAPVGLDLAAQISASPGSGWAPTAVGRPDPELPDPGLPDPECRDSPRAGWRLVPSGTRGRRAMVLVVAGLAAADIAFGVWSAVLGIRHAHQDAVSTASRQALDAATRAIGPVTSYDYQRFPADVATASRYLTTAFAAQYTTLATKDTEPTAVKYHVIVKATVAAAAVQQGGADQVSVMVFLDQSSTSTLHSGPRIDQSRLLVRMQKISGRWLVAGVQAL